MTSDGTSDGTGQGHVVLTFAPRATRPTAPVAPAGASAPPDAYTRLERALPEEKAAIVRKLIDAHPEGRLVLPLRGGRCADLTGANLRDAALGQSDLEGARLEGVNLEGASLDRARLRDAVLSEARLRDLDLSPCGIAHIHAIGPWLRRGLG